MLKDSSKIPERDCIIRLLNKMPEKYASVKEHSLLCELAAEEIAKQLKENGVKINSEFVSRAALAHDAFKQFGEKGNECFLAKDYFSKKRFSRICRSTGNKHSSEF